MAKSHYIVPFFIPHVGCPHDCVFCNQKKITGQSEEVHPKDIIPTIKQYVSTFTHKPEKVEAAFFGGSFTGIPTDKQREYLEEVHRALQSGLIDGIRLSTRPDYIDTDVLSLLKRYEVDIIELGVQSLDDEVLKKSFRGHSSDDVRAAAQLVHEFGFTLGMQMMIGLPADTYEKDISAAEGISGMKADIVRIYPALVIKGTALERMYANNMYKPLEVREAVDICTGLVKIFVRNDINVIRIGLQPTDNIASGKEVIAGPFHPAFRQLVESSVIREIIKKVLTERVQINNGMLRLEVNPSLVSTVIGNKKETLQWLAEEYPRMEFSIRADTHVDQDNIRFVSERDFVEVNYTDIIKQMD